ncbi:MAG: hypothetical protein IH968_07830 [Gemmatimonadetes bacterium]|nr:hypothetical protein [Gemmatimonadota bacterium]
MVPQQRSRLRGSTRPLFLAALALLAVVPGPTGAQQRPQSHKSGSPPIYRDVLGRSITLGAVATAHARGAAATVVELEPNNDISTANAANIGDLIVGDITASGDIDFFRLDGVPAGTEIELDVDARAIGSTLDSTVGLYDATGVRIAFNDDADGSDSRLTHTIPETGTYFAAVAGFGSSFGFYQLTIGTLEPGPADPTTLFTTGFDTPWGMAAGSTGDLYVVDLGPGTVSRVAPDGTVSAIASGLDGAFDIVVDAFGKLLVTEANTGNVLRLNPETGEQSVFASGLSIPLAITVGPDGDVWVAETTGIGHFDSDGNRLETIGLGSSSRPLLMAFSPEGVLHYSVERTTIHRVENGAQSVVLTADFVVEGIAFDEGGFLYIVNGFLGRVDLYDASYQLVGPAIARTNIGGPSNLVFLRDADGNMTDRLLVSNFGFRLDPPFVGGIVELNSDGIAAPGFRVGSDFLRVVSPIPAAVIGAPYVHALAVEEAVSAPTWQILDGILPAGLSLASTGDFSGIPETDGTFDFRVQVDAVGTSGQPRFGRANLTLTVERPQVSAANVANQLLGVPGALTVDEERFLDLIGNRNGRLDLGDYLLFLRDQGILALTLTSPITN